jgi:hypothetical protein
MIDVMRTKTECWNIAVYDPTTDRQIPSSLPPVRNTYEDEEYCPRYPSIPIGFALGAQIVNIVNACNDQCP